jgi:RNA polymerase sigma-70 factor (ECF subfamily)
VSDIDGPSPIEADPQLLNRAKAGDEEAFGTLMREHYERVFRLVLGILNNEHDARDVCQEVWLTVWKNLKNFRGDARFTTWVHPIAVRRSIDHLRRRRRWLSRFVPFLADDNTEMTHEAVPEPQETTDPRRDVERTERDQRFERALAAMPPKHRAVLALREIDGLSYDEIAKAMNIRPGTVMSRLYHARRLLARKLGELPCD